MPPFESSTPTSVNDSDGRTHLQREVPETRHRPQIEPGSWNIGDEFGSQQRLDEQPVERRVRLGKPVGGRAVRLILTFHFASEAIIRRRGVRAPARDDDAGLASASRCRRSRNSRDVTRRAYNLSDDKRPTCAPSTATARRCHPGNPQRLSERVRPDLCQSLNRLCRQAGHA